MAVNLPKYMSDVLKFSILENGLYSALPHLMMLFVAICVGFLSDYLTNKHYLSITNTRKLFTTICKCVLLTITYLFKVFVKNFFF